MSLSSAPDSRQSAMDDLSSLMDGELEACDVARACAQWRDDPDARAKWHAYHLIGDALRSEDLAVDGAHDAAFLAEFRKRIALEPVVLAPVARPAPVVVKRRRTWAAPAAVAAGFVAVAGVLVVTQMSGGLPQSVRSPEALTANAAGQTGLVPVIAATQPALAASVGDPQAVVLNGQLIRDVRLDEYLAAHKKFGGSTAVGGPSGFLRNAAAEASAR